MTTRSEQPTQVADVRVGDYLDLKGDPYADPNHDNIYLEYEYVLVAGLERETPDCIRLDLEGFDSVGFPPDHRVRVVSHDEGYE